MTHKIINPATGEVITEVALAGERDIELVLTSARAAFDNGPWPKLSLAERKDFLLKISRGILDSAANLAKIETQNTGKPIKESTFMDVPSAAKAFEHFANHLEEYLKPEKMELENAESRLLRQPLGVVALIVPWNYPLLIASWKLAQALAAGNTVILKPSSLTPLSVLELAKIIAGTGIPKGVVNILNAEGRLVGEKLCSDARLDMISFTGSNKVGKQILQYSAQNVKKLTMELGGKSAAIILKDADLEAAVNGSLCSIFLNQGQMCTAMSRIFIHKDIYDKFINDFVEKAKRIKLGKGEDYETQMGALISFSQRNRVMEFIEKAKEQGVQVLCGGNIPADPKLKNGFFFEPTVIAEVNSGMDVFQEEIFGPVVCVGKFSTPEEAVELANRSDYALACSVWSKDDSAACALAEKVNAGICWVNTYGMFYPQVPYGGFKQSGFGKELGKDGFLGYTRLKNVFTDKTKDAKPLVNYWYGF